MCPLQDYSSHASNSINSDFEHANRDSTRINVWMDMISPLARPTMLVDAIRQWFLLSFNSTHHIDLSSHGYVCSLARAKSAIVDE